MPPSLQSSRSGVITILDERYLLLRASSLSVEFYSAILDTLDSGKGRGGLSISPKNLTHKLHRRVKHEPL